MPETRSMVSNTDFTRNVRFNLSHITVDVKLKTNASFFQTLFVLFYEGGESFYDFLKSNQGQSIKPWPTFQSIQTMSMNLLCK